MILKPLIKWYIKDTRRSYALITKGNQILLVRNWLGNGTWSLPGGGAHANETYAAAVAREVFEEVGIRFDPSSFEPVIQGTWTSYGFSYLYCCSSVQIMNDIPLTAQRFEIIDAQFVDLHEVRESANIAPEILHAITRLQARKTI